MDDKNNNVESISNEKKGNLLTSELEKVILSILKREKKCFSRIFVKKSQIIKKEPIVNIDDEYQNYIKNIFFNIDKLYDISLSKESMIKGLILKIKKLEEDKIPIKDTSSNDIIIYDANTNVENIMDKEYEDTNLSYDLMKNLRLSNIGSKDKTINKIIVEEKDDDLIENYQIKNEFKYGLSRFK